MCDPEGEVDLYDFDPYGPGAVYSFKPRTWLDRWILRKVREDYYRERAEAMRRRDERRREQRPAG